MGVELLWRKLVRSEKRTRCENIGILIGLESVRYALELVALTPDDESISSALRSSIVEANASHDRQILSDRV